MPQAGAVLDQAELIALPVSWQIVIVKTKSTGFTPKTSELRKMADRTSSAAITDCSTGFELETRNSATDHDDSGGGWSLSVGALRQWCGLPAFQGESGSPNLASFEAHGVARADDTPTPPGAKLRRG